MTSHSHKLQQPVKTTAGSRGVLELTVYVRSRTKGRVLRQRSGNIVVGTIGFAICLVRIVVVLKQSTRLRANPSGGLRQNGKVTFISTLQSHANVVCGTAAMSNGVWRDVVKLG
jgi:hypothetical protein